MLTVQYGELRANLPALELPELETLVVRYAAARESTMIVEASPPGAASMLQKMVRAAITELAPGLRSVGVDVISVIGSGFPSVEMLPPAPPDLSVN